MSFSFSTIFCTPLQFNEYWFSNSQQIHALSLKRELHAGQLKDRFEQARTVSGTRDNHCYVPIGLGTLQVSRVSGDDSYFTAKVSDADIFMRPYEVGSHIAIVKSVCRLSVPLVNCGQTVTDRPIVTMGDK